MSETYDLLVIGAGAAGSAAARAGVTRGARVIQVERDKIGGTCLNYGCDPTKTLLHVAQELYRARQSEKFGLAIPLSSLEWQQVQTYVHSVVEQMRGGTTEQASEQLRQQGIEFLAGEARFVSPREVVVNGQTITAERIIIATGCQATVPEITGLHEAGFLTNVGAVWLPTLPDRLAIIGGGAIGIEFAQMFQRFGVKVTVIERNAQILEKEERELAEMVSCVLEREGIELITGAELQRVQSISTGKRLTYCRGPEGERELVVDDILVALGRRPALEKLGLETIGVKTSKKGVEVDKTLRTSLPHIWAAGDVASSYTFTHVASKQGSLAAHNAFAERPMPFDDRVIPWVTFTDPPLAHVGRTEDELRQANVVYKAARVEFKELERALIIGQTEGLIKLLVDEQGQLLGGHILGPRADELLAPLILAMHSHLPIAQLAATLLPYPTLSEGLRVVARQFK
jgi:pyruvate/2-oxoglutarate dehydrogenase complex dihydrolipoamide dehydrogenase (E3) component